MASDQTKQSSPPQEPRGFGQRTRGLAGEYAHEQGWGLDTEERTRLPETPQDTDGGTDYEYGARDFGDEPVNTSIDHTGTQGNVAASAATPGITPDNPQSNTQNKE